VHIIVVTNNGLLHWMITGSDHRSDPINFRPSYDQNGRHSEPNGVLYTMLRFLFAV